MKRTISQAFDEFLGRLTPTEAQRAAAASHRKSVEDAINAARDTYAFRETGSFHHGTAVRGHVDVDILVSLAGGQPGSSDTALGWIKEALTTAFPLTTVRISRPAIVVEFASGAETWEVIPGFLTDRSDDLFVYDIPDVPSGWMTSAPFEHLSYVNECNSKATIKGAAKKLSRLAKAWKYYNSVPISSFYLEMRAAQYMAGQTSYVPIYDLPLFFAHIDGLHAMNDPKGVTTRFHPCSSEYYKTQAQSKLSTAITRANKALDADKKDDATDAFYWLDRVFDGNFPAQYY